MADKGKRPMNPLLRDTSEATPEPSRKLVEMVTENIPAPRAPEPAQDEYVMPRTRRRRALKFDELYDPLSSYIDKRYVQAFETLVNEAGPNKTAILNEAIYDLLIKKRDILAEYGVDVESLPRPRK